MSTVIQTKRVTAPSKPRISAYTRHQWLNGFLFLLPWFIGFFAFQLLPILFTLFLAFTDYRGAIKTHEMGINLKGATHDAIAYGRTEFVARLEAPVIYPPEVQLHDLHAGARHGRIVNPAPEVAPDINIAVDTLAAAIVAPGVTR